MCAGISLRDRWREKENAGEISAASHTGIDEWSEVAVVAGHDDTLFGDRALQDLRVTRAPEADYAGVNRLYTPVPQLIARSSKNVHVEEKPHNEPASACAPSRNRPTRSFASIIASIRSGKRR